LLAGKDEIAAIVRHHFGDGLTGKEIVAQIDGAQRCQPRVMLAEPAFDGVALAILLLGAILRRDEFGHQRHDFAMAGRHHRRRQHGMIGLGLAVGPLAREAMRTTDFLGAEILRSVPGEEGSPAQSAKGMAHGRLVQEILQALEAGRQQRRIRLVQHVADVVVGGDFLDPEQGLAVRAALAFLQHPLE
jgi:hypothetical protein